MEHGDKVDFVVGCGDNHHYCCDSTGLKATVTRLVEDADGDGVADLTDNCPAVANPDQADLDGDGQGDACDLDDDGDGINDEADNCPGVANASQTDLDDDGQGDACDPDDGGDGLSDEADACPLENASGSDANVDGCVDRIEDLTAVIHRLGLPADVEADLLDSAIAAAASIIRGQYKPAASSGP